MIKGMKAMPGSKKQKDIIKQINHIRIRLKMPLMKEELELDEVFNVGKMSDAKLKAFIAGFDSDERMGMAAAMQLKAAKKEARKRGIKEDDEIDEYVPSFKVLAQPVKDVYKILSKNDWVLKQPMGDDRVIKLLKKYDDPKKVADVIMKKHPLLREAKKAKLPPHLAKFFDKKGNLKKDAADRIKKGRKERGTKITDRTPDWMFPEEAPPGWAGTIKAMKKKKEVEIIRQRKRRQNDNY
jgi:hypothetical protein